MRLPVILVQNSPANGSAVAEALVASLIGHPGLDLTLVDRFDSLAPDSTDRMTLAGITVPAAVLDWRTPEELFTTLQGIEFQGYRCAHQLDPDPGPPDSAHRRRLFLFDLNDHRDAKQIVAELDRIRDSLSVKTVSLGGLAPPKPAPQNAGVEKAAPNHPPANTVSSVSNSKTKHPPITLNQDPTDDTLNELLDQLDDLDV
ncbi:hypothetical protein [Roseiconus lacunae]|uniref:hypothetical protein n=1 Tax=Roseiconus lacunae TaxID=2605694 RepID=UPI001E2AB237|nr:hypothetical protein [Roseiconus lacunae]MCD0462809.1 hypothetical protein [Roseiconus lacunae]